MSIDIDELLFGHKRKEILEQIEADIITGFPIDQTSAWWMFLEIKRLEAIIRSSEEANEYPN